MSNEAIPEPDDLEAIPCLEGLTERQKSFVLHYVGDAHYNATKAALLAGYSEETARSIGSQNLTKVNISAAIKGLLETHGLVAQECIARISQRARASIADVLTFTEGGDWFFDMQKAVETGAIHCVKRVRPVTVQTKDGATVRHIVEMYDAAEADATLLKVFGRLSGGIPEEEEENNNGQQQPRKIVIVYESEDRFGNRIPYKEPTASPYESE
jgi:phage terminase small subunit